MGSSYDVLLKVLRWCGRSAYDVLVQDGLSLELVTTFSRRWTASSPASTACSSSLGKFNSTVPYSHTELTSPTRAIWWRSSCGDLIVRRLISSSWSTSFTTPLTNQAQKTWVALFIIYTNVFKQEFVRPRWPYDMRPLHVCHCNSL